MANQVFNQPLNMTAQAPGNLTLADAGNISLFFSYDKGVSTQNAVTASATQTQVGGRKVTAAITVVTIAGANDAVTLPTAEAGRKLSVVNTSGQTITIFPALADRIGANAVNASVTSVTAQLISFVCGVRGTWWGSIATVL